MIKTTKLILTNLINQKNYYLRHLFPEVENLTPSLRFKGYSNKWMFKKISFIYKDTEIIGGGTPSTRVREYYDNGQVNWFNVVDLKQKYVYSTINKITELGVQKSAAKIFPKNSVVLGCSATIGDCCISKSKSSCKQGLFAFIPNDKIYHEYLYYVFVINKLSLKKLASGAGSTFPNINKSMLKEFEIPIPPTLEEQQAIANFLSKIDDAIEREILRIMSTQKQYYLNNMFPKSNQNIPMIRFRGFSDEWKNVSLSHITNYTQPSIHYYQASKSTSLKNENNGNLVPVYTAGKTYLMGYIEKQTNLKTFNRVPCILFDDFTTEAKIISVPFYTSSSASKIITLTKEYEFLPYEILLNLISSLNIEKISHGRHWISQYQNSDVKLPINIDEIKLIGKTLERINH